MWEDVTRNGDLVGKNIIIIIIIIIHQHYHYIKTYSCSDDHGAACPDNFNIISFYYFDLALVSDHNYYDLSFIIRLR